MLPLSVPVVSSRFAQVIPSRCLVSGSFALVIETLSLDASGAFRATPFHAFVSGLHTVDVVVIYRVPLREEENCTPFWFSPFNHRASWRTSSKYSRSSYPARVPC